MILLVYRSKSEKVDSVHLRERKGVGTRKLNLLKNPMLKQDAYPCIWAGKPPHLLKLLSPGATMFTSINTRTELVGKRERLLKIEEERRKEQTLLDLSKISHKNGYTELLVLHLLPLLNSWLIVEM